MKKFLGIIVLGLLLSGNANSKELNADSFFNEFNMRSIYSSVGNWLKHSCDESYPFEIFKIKEQNNHSITLVNGVDLFWTIKFLGNNKIELTDQITSGTYLTTNVYELKYISDINEWWSIDDANLNKLKIPLSGDCEKLSSQSANTDEFKDGEYIGQEAFTDKYGNTYVGEWKDGKYDGQGTLTWTSGGKYVGGWKDGEFHGQGTFTFAGGDKYVGEFKDSSRNGQGTYTYVDGTVEKGIWENGELVEPN